MVAHQEPTFTETRPIVIAHPFSETPSIAGRQRFTSSTGIWPAFVITLVGGLFAVFNAYVLSQVAGQ